MLPGFSAGPVNNLFSSENSSVFASTMTDSGTHANTDIGQALKSLCLLPSWLNSTGGVEDRSRTNLIINYLPQSYDQSDLQRLFERLGPIRQCKLIRDKNTGASLCYGFVDYISPQHAALAIQTYHGYETESKRLRVAYASSGGRRYLSGQRTPSGDIGSVNCVNEPSENVLGWEICVAGLPSEVSESDIMRLFSHFGRILWVRFLPSDAMKTATSALADLNCNTTEANLFGTRGQISSKGPMTSIIFEERSSCDTAIGRLNGLQLPDCPTPLCLRLIGPVTRETFDMFYLNSRLGSDCSSLAGLQPRQISGAQCHLQEKLGLPGSACSVTNGILKMSHPRSTLEAIEPNENALPSLTSLQPRPIIRNKTYTGSNLLDNVDFADLLDGSAVANGISRSIVDRISSPDTQSLFAKQAHQGMDLIAKPDLGSQMSWNSGASLMPLTSVDQFRSTLRAPELAVPKKLSIATPLLLSPQLSAAVSTKGGRANVYLKLENLQPTGSVLFRGMEYACRKFASLGGAQHIVCPSTGNAGVAAAFAAQSLGMACTVVTPEGNESLTRKRLSIEAPSAKLVSFGSTLSEASRRAEQMVNDANEQLQQINGTTDSAVRFLHPYDQTDVWAGYESIIEELPAGQQPDLIVLAVGGGGLLSGLIQGLWNRSWSSTHILAVETEGADCLSRSVAAGHPVVMPKCTSVATSLCAPSLSLRAWSMIQCHPVTAITCSDLEAVQAARRFLDDHGMLVEPACGAALSAVYSGAIAKLQQENVIPRPANVCVILCGGRNTNLQLLTECERKLTTGCGGGTGINNNSKTFGLKQLNGFGGPEVFLADLTEAPMTARSMDENIDQFSDIPTSSSSTSSASDSVVRASSKTHMDTDDQSRE
ncbi:hypothetical protein AAHC03_010128 [Spirometra sp. Aus1]